MRVIGLDLGSRRIGVAVTDPTGTIAAPYSVIVRLSIVSSAIGIVAIFSAVLACLAAAARSAASL